MMLNQVLKTDWSIFALQSFFLPSSCNVVHRGIKIASPTRYNFAIKAKPRTMKKCSYSPKSLAQAQ